MKRNIIRGVFYLIGLYVLSFGIDLMIVANVGTSAWDALNVGLNRQFDITVGRAAQLVGVVLIFIIAIMRKRRPELFPLLTMLVLGSLIDFNLSWLTLSFDSWITAFVVALIGLVFIALGIAIYIQANFGIIPIDGFVMAIQEKSGWSIQVSKTVAEFSALTVAFFLGGSIGVGTIVATFLIGPLFQFFYKVIKEQYDIVFAG